VKFAENGPGTLGEKLIRLEEPPDDTLSFESSSEEQAVEDDFAEEMIKYQDEKLSPVPLLVKNLRRGTTTLSICL
jgi:hypothetical protein